MGAAKGNYCVILRDCLRMYCISMFRFVEKTIASHHFFLGLVRLIMCSLCMYPSLTVPVIVIVSIPHNDILQQESELSSLLASIAHFIQIHSTRMIRFALNLLDGALALYAADLDLEMLNDEVHGPHVTEDIVSPVKLHTHTPTTDIKNASVMNLCIAADIAKPAIPALASRGRRYVVKKYSQSGQFLAAAATASHNTTNKNLLVEDGIDVSNPHRCQHKGIGQRTSRLDSWYIQRYGVEIGGTRILHEATKAHLPREIRSIRSLLKSISEFNQNIPTDGGTCLSKDIIAGGNTINGDATTLLLLYCYNIAFDRVDKANHSPSEASEQEDDAPKKSFSDLFQIYLRHFCLNDTDSTEPSIMEEMAAAYISGRKNDQIDLEKFSNEYIHQVDAILQLSVGKSIAECQVYLKELEVHQFKNGPFEYVILDKLSRISPYLQKQLEHKKAVKARIYRNNLNYTGYVKWAISQEYSTLHGYCKSVLQELEIWKPRQYRSDLKKLRGLIASQLGVFSKRQQFASIFYGLVRR